MGFAAALAAIVLTGFDRQRRAAAPTLVRHDSKRTTADPVSVEVVGNGPDVVFIPGLASSRETWK